jgi:hypothetical protein
MSPFMLWIINSNVFKISETLSLFLNGATPKKHKNMLETAFVHA